jgi:hypothetical protein
MLLDHLHVELTHVAADLDRRQIKSIGSAKFSAVIGEAALDEYLAGEAPEGESLRNVHLYLHHNSVSISAERVTLGLGVPFRAYGPMRVVDPQHIEMDPTRLVVVGIPITGAALVFLKHKFESAIDLSSLPIPIAIDSVKTENHILVLSGAPDVSAMIRMHAEDLKK